MRRFIEAADVIILNPKDKTRIDIIAYIIQGEAEGHQETYVKGSYVPRGK